jgi:dipeptidyl aminopeptidase/acylaminoacyl peptidase
MAKTAPYGSWKSPITSERIVAETIGLGQPLFDGESLYWLELRPREGGRTVLVRRGADGTTADVTPPPLSVRSLVHEYGGGAYTVADGTLYFSDFSDQRVYRQDRTGRCHPITPEADLRYADFVVDRRRNLLYCVREDHTGPGEATNTLVRLECSGDERRAEVIARGSDFYSSPRLSPDGSRLAWLSWNHPNMPWDGTELWVGELDANGSVIGARTVAGGPAESVFQPEWSPDGVLHFVSDRTGWWNLYRQRDGKTEALCPMPAEFGQPQWGFGMSTYAFESAERILCTYSRQGASHLMSIDTATAEQKRIETPYSLLSYVRTAAGRAVFIAGSPLQSLSVSLLDLATASIEVVRRESTIRADPAYTSVPRAIEFPTTGGLTAYAFYYPPHNADFAAPDGERPPLLVLSHGGPTGATNSVFRTQIQYWTSRGIAVLDVNYGGSTGYGRAYRERLAGQWGIVDVDDCISGARYLIEHNEVDDKRLAIAGGSAGGYTTLCALTFRKVFRAGASRYGISDLEALIKSTHKFESRYLESLIGPYPERRDLYVERSPIHFTEQLACPLILFQGSEDKAVPPDQARSMYEAAKRKGLLVAYLEFEGEQHGFRKAENIKRALDAELFFYATIFGFEPADPIDPVPIANL